MRATSILLVAVVALVGCGEKAQTAGTRKADAGPYQGAAAAFTANGWKAGDATSWEAQMKIRAQRGQDEYTRTGAP